MPVSNARTTDVILKAAELIQEQGFEATTVNDISRATGLTKGGLYHYIKGKRDLLYQIMRFGMDQLRTQVVQPVQQIEDPEQQLRTLIRLHIELISQGKGALTTLSEEVQGLEPRHRRHILTQKREYFEFVRGMIERLQRARRVRADLNPSVAAFNILGMVLFFARWYREDGSLAPTAVADQAAELALSGLLKRPK
jgi:AcrR family transcriptional regulator